MSLSCSCQEGDYWYFGPDKFETFPVGRRKRCCSCKKLINIADVCTKFSRYRAPLSDIEELIYGEEVAMADWYMCERCSELYMNFDELGYCIYLGDSMEDLLKDYWLMTGFDPKKYDGCIGVGVE